MKLLAPASLAWLGAIPVLLWLWRLASTRRQIVVPSLVPFEHLIRRQGRQRSRLVVNALFWLQCAALTGLALALARPVILRPDATTHLVVLDTSASMGAALRGPSAYEQASRALLKRIARKSPRDQFFIVTTAPIMAALPEPTSDAAALARAVSEIRVSHLGGNLGMALRLGRSLLGREPDRVHVLTDEAPPADEGAPAAEWTTVGRPLANVAIVGIDAQGALCAPSEARVIATVQNFSDQPTRVEVSATRRGQRLAQAAADLGPRARRSIALALPDDDEGLVEVGLTVQADGLGADDRAWVELRRSAGTPVSLRSTRPALERTISTWLAACQALARGTGEAPADGSHVLITDNLAAATPPPVAAMVFIPPEAAAVSVNHWVVAGDHPVGSYLAPVEVVAAALNPSASLAGSATPVITALVQGRKLPVVAVDEQEGWRVVSMFLDPSRSADSVPLLLAFFNGLRWLTSSARAVTAGEPLVAGPFEPGVATVLHPDGSTHAVHVDGAVLRYDATSLAGIYRLSQGARTVMTAVNFFDPLESNLSQRVSTWRPLSAPSVVPAGKGSTRRSEQPLSDALLLFVLAALLIEWWRYGLRGRSDRLTSSSLPSVEAGRSSAAAHSAVAPAGRRLEAGVLR